MGGLSDVLGLQSVNEVAKDGMPRGLSLSSRFVPFGWMWSSLIMEANVDADCKWGRCLVCSFHFSADRMWRLRREVSRLSKVSFHVGQGLDGSGVLRYRNTAC